MPDIDLNDYEMQLVTDAGILLAKNRIIEKVIAMFGQLQEVLAEPITALNDPSIAGIPLKISKGEKYLGLPYVILDYPRIFSRNDTFAIRILFWWGHHFSIHLQLAGAYKTRYQPALQKAIQSGLLNDWFICVHQSEWHHHFMEDNYVPVDETMAIDLPAKSFIKVAKKIPLAEWNQISAILLQNYKKLVTLLQA